MIATRPNLFANGTCKYQTALRGRSRRSQRVAVNQEGVAPKYLILRIRREGHGIRPVLGCVVRFIDDIQAARNRPDIVNRLKGWIVFAFTGPGIARAEFRPVVGECPVGLSKGP